ncbi:hypothetical protein GOZ83_13155 [Agrobacterium vitis]|uniref:DUF6929 family protein n=1 Tax=Rhizobium/Agrobacterium group TaxID=227290 RepID=UPI0012E7CE8A|nr:MULTISPECIES: hypothetical protein [Rhizobium/Agrobacterium group]MCF1494505.1 hypothetical protein [Allorhizobium ampelinum]MVA46011.1 hypothetical protein [Agrobacterium vitis]
MITVTEIRALNISAATTKNRPLHLSAASGLVCVGSTIYVVADDELHLGVFSTQLPEPGRLVRLFEGVLPDKKAERKRMKPDLEALTLVPAFESFPHGALLALGSASRPNRGRGALLILDRAGTVCGPPQKLNMSPILGPLHEAFDELNIEGAVVVGDELRLFQRGNKGQADNAIISYCLWQVLAALQSDEAEPIRPSGINWLNLGMIAGVPFCFTDAAALASGDMVFCAVAEDTQDAYRDGPCIGAAIGIVSHDGQLLSMQQLNRPYKVEGISVQEHADRLDFLLVTDADDAAIPALLLSTSILR